LFESRGRPKTFDIGVAKISKKLCKLY